MLSKMDTTDSVCVNGNILTDSTNICDEDKAHQQTPATVEGAVDDKEALQGGLRFHVDPFENNY